MIKLVQAIMKTAIIGIFFLFFLSNSSHAQSKTEKIEQLMSAYADYGHFNGSILIAEKGEIIYNKGFGLANMEWDIPNQPDTRFRLASVTKQFTAMLIVQLVADNILALNVPISTYLPDYPKEDADRITIHHLLTHTSGIPNYTSFSNYRELMRDPIRPTEIVALFADSMLQFAPGEKHEYSNSGYVLLGVIIEKVTGKSFEQVLQDKILTPLEMNNTGYDSQRTIIKNRAAGYYKRGNAFQNANYIDMSRAFTAGGMFSTVEDLFLWDQALYTDKLLPKKYMDLIFEKHVPVYGRHYGYGWEIGEMAKGSTRERVDVVNHSGVINGFHTLISRIPADKSSIILLNNTGGAPLYEMSRAIGGILYDKPYDFPKKSIADALLKVLANEGIAKGHAFYEETKDSPDYDLNENEMNLAGYELLQSGEINKAEFVFRLNVDEFPGSSNAYDSYGEVLLALGRETEAIDNYKRSITLNPENVNGINVLNDLNVDFVVPGKDALFFLHADSTWGREIFHFPLNFAPEMKYVGIEEARFLPGWSNVESDEFWTYIFAWNIELDHELTQEELEQKLQLYFDGLMEGVNKDKNLIPPKTKTQFQQKMDDGIPTYVGTVQIFDAFTTKDNLILNVRINQHVCTDKGKAVILFKFSPKEFGHGIWVDLNKVKLDAKMCDVLPVIKRSR